MSAVGSVRGVIAGGFDLVHLGHLDHIKKARALCDHLIVITHPDEVLVRTHGYCVRPLEVRIADLLSRSEVSDVVWTADDGDGTVADALAILKPDQFYKGGDRTKTRMPPSELEVCKKHGIEIVYGVGDLLGSGSEMARKAGIL